MYDVGVFGYVVLGQYVINVVMLSCIVSWYVVLCYVAV